MQEETSQNLHFLNRLEKLKLAKDWTWEEAAKAIGLSRTMVHFIKTGKHGVSAKNWHRLDEAERRAGIQPRTSSAGPDTATIAAAVSKAEREAKVKITYKEIDQGYVEVPLHYRRGVPPEGYPKKLNVSAPASRQAAQALAAVKLDEDFSVLLSSCLPKEYSTSEFLDKLTPFSYQAVLESALTMTFGLDWQKLLGRESA